MSRLIPLINILFIISLILTSVGVFAQNECGDRIILNGKSSYSLKNQRSELEVCINIKRSVNNKVYYEYEIAEGIPVEDFVLTWNFNYFNSLGDSKQIIIRFPVQGKEAKGSRLIPDCFNYDKSKLWEHPELITAESAGIPGPDVVKSIQVRPEGSDLFFEGEVVDFSLKYGLQKGVVTTWKVTNGTTISSENNRLRLKAKQDLQVSVSFTNGIFKGGPYKIDVPQISPLSKYYLFDEPDLRRYDHPDTSTLDLGIVATRSSLAGFQWNWTYRDKRSGKMMQAGTGNRLTRTPSVLSPIDNISATLEYSGRVLAKRDFNVSVFEVPGPLGMMKGEPMEFKVSPMGILFVGEPGTFKAIEPVGKKWSAGTKWVWRFGNHTDTTTQPIYVIKHIDPRTTLHVYAYYNTKRTPDIRVDLRNIVKRKSRLPESVDGDTAICAGSTKILRFLFSDGDLGSDNSQWVLELGSKVYRSNVPDFQIPPPPKPGRYAARVYPNNEFEKSYNFAVTVYAPPIVPDSIVQVNPKGEVCPGNELLLSADLKKSSSKAIWDWYVVEGTSPARFVSTGDTLRCIVQKNSRYILKSRTSQCVSSLQREKTVYVKEFNYKPDFKQNTAKALSRLRSFTVTSLDLPGLRYEWYVNGEILAGEKSRSTSLHTFPRGNSQVTLRVKNDCGIEREASKAIEIPRPRPFYFLGLGGANNRLDAFPSLVATVGGRGFYIRMKGNPLFMPVAQKQKTGLNGTSLEINDLSSITNFPTGTGSYYEVKPSVRARQTSISMGTVVPVIIPQSKYQPLPVALMVGLGYGSREVFWQADVVSYADQSVKTYWAKNTDQSWKGLELETGLFIPVSEKLFVMPGFSAIFDAGRKVPYRSISLSVGLAIESKTENKR